MPLAHRGARVVGVDIWEALLHTLPAYALDRTLLRWFPTLTPFSGIRVVALQKA